MAAFSDLAPFLAGNAQWADDTHAAEPAFLPALATGQRPPVLWIGCADSRVPETAVLGARPGDVFVHRNVANQFQKDDTSANAVLDYAVLHLGVTHVVVVGHTACGGCKAAYAAPKPTESSEHPLTKWLEPLVALRHSLPEGASLRDLTTANVRAGIENIVESETIKEAWSKGLQVYVHGWLYDLASGRITDLDMTVGPK